MKIHGIENLNQEELQRELSRGGRFIHYQYVVSALFVTFRRSTAVYFIRGGESPIVKGLPWTMLTLLLGWWGFPWGLIYTPVVLVKNLGGGTDVTALLLAPASTPTNASVSNSSPPPPPLKI
jgi:hypothetical protein